MNMYAVVITQEDSDMCVPCVIIASNDDDLVSRIHRTAGEMGIEKFKFAFNKISNKFIKRYYADMLLNEIDMEET